MNNDKFENHFDISYIDTLRPELFKKIANLFLKQNENSLEEFKTLLEKKDYQELRKKIHFLNGSSVNIGATSLATMIEDSIDDRDYEQIQPQMHDLETILIESLNYLKNKIK